MRKPGMFEPVAGTNLVLLDDVPTNKPPVGEGSNSCFVKQFDSYHSMDYRTRIFKAISEKLRRRKLHACSCILYIVVIKKSSMKTQT